MSQTLSMAIEENSKYVLSIAKVMDADNKFIQNRNKLNLINVTFNKQVADSTKEMDKSGSAFGLVANKISSLISKAELGKKAFRGMVSVMKTAELQKSQEATFQAQLNNKSVGTQMHAYVGEYAKKSALGRTGVANSVSSFLNVTRDMSQIEQLLNLTERLNAKNPQKGAEGASSAITSALAGDTTTLSRDYGIMGINDQSLMQGDTASGINQIDSAMKSSGATQSLADNHFNGFSTQVGVFSDTLQSTIAEKAQPILENLSLIMQQLNADLESGKFEPFINLMVKGMQMVGDAISFVIDNASWLVPVLAGVVAGIIAYNIATAIAAVVTMGLTQNWGGIAALGVALTATVVGMGIAMQDVEDRSANAGKDIDGIRDGLGESLPSTPMPTEITNTAPIAISGEVDIEKENLKYMMDMAGQKFFAQYSHNTVVPQQQITMNVSKTVDADEVLGYVANGLTEMTAGAPQGVYA